MTRGVLEREVREALDAALRACDGAACVRDWLSRNSLRARGRLVVLAWGKAAGAMTEGALGAGLRAHRTVAVIKRGGLRPEGAEVLEASHPLPDTSCVAAAEALLAAVAGLSEGDVVLALSSGGGTSLLAAPVPGVTLPEMTAAFTALQRDGVAIAEANAVRARLSRVAAGRLARAAAPARVVTLVISDVPGDDPALVSSGPTAGSESHVVARPADAVRAAADALRLATPRVVAWDERLSGEAEDTAARIVGALRSAPPGTAIVAAGETTVVGGHGRPGGRNVHLAAAAARHLSGGPPALLASVATDGDDGTSGSAGAIVDERTWEAARDPGRSLRDRDALSIVGERGLLDPWPTRTNVADLVIAVSAP